MKKDGFTLIELLSIIILLAVIIVLTYPKVVEMFEKKQTEIDDATLKLIYGGVDDYLEMKSDLYPNTIGSNYCISLDEIDKEKLVPTDISKYKDKGVSVKIGKGKNIYKIVDECGKNILLTYELNGGTLDKTSDEIQSGTSITLPIPLKDNYTFLGWYTENTGGEEVTNSTVFTEATTIYAKYFKTVEEFAYTGSEQTFTAPKTGKYKLETWGAQGGNSNNSNYHGGYGGYSVGNITLNKNDVLYVVVGAQGQTNCNLSVCKGGYNGGGSAGYYTGGSVYNGGGGGATHIATVTGELKNLSSYKDTGGTNISNEIIIVAGGGGAGTAHNNTSTFGFNHAGGNGGGISGTGRCGSSDYADSISCSGCGGNQTSTGAITSTTSTYGTYGGFGYGATNSCSSGGSGSSRKCYAPGGGGGWYGGSTGNHGTGGGGSGYIGSSNLISSNGITKHMTCVDCTESNDLNTKTESNTCHNSTATVDCAKEGSGYAKITYIGE